MDTLSISDLHADPKNPRTINKNEYAKLKELLKKFGDLSGIIRNVRTDQLVGGHMRVKAFEESSGEKNVQITQHFFKATEAGTTAIGYVVINGEMFAYREVDWDLGMQRAANLAANKAGGEFDKDALSEIMYELSQLENSDELLNLTAFDESEVDKLLKSVSGEDESPAEDNEEKEPKLVFKITPEQKATIVSILDRIKSEHLIVGDDDEISNGRALVILVDSYGTNVPSQPAPDFTPPELPQL